MQKNLVALALVGAVLATGCVATDQTSESEAYATGPATITTDASTYYYAQPVVVSFSGLNGNAVDWIAIAPQGSPVTSVTKWHYTGGGASGSMTLQGPGTGGSYVARAFDNDTYTLMGESNPFTVGAAVPNSATITTDRTGYLLSDPIKVNWTGLTGSAMDWVSIAPETSSDALTTDWLYTGGGTSGSITFVDGVLPTGYPPGRYVARGYLNGTFFKAGESAAFTVDAPTLVSILVTPEDTSIAKGTTQQFTAIGTYNDSSTQDLTTQVTWTSTVTTVATISNTAGTKGLATSPNSGSTGTTTIVATLGSVTGSTTLTVTAATLSDLDVVPVSPTAAKGTTVQFTATGTFTDGSSQDVTTQVTWTSSPTAIATISNATGSQGLATAVAVGTATITATLGSISDSTSLTVTSATLSSIAVTPINPSTPKGTTVQFTATGTFSDATTQNITTQVTWSAANLSLVTISNTAGSQGLATAWDVGSSAIKAQLGTLSGSTTLTVTAVSLVSISVTPVTVKVAKGYKVQFIATGTYNDSSTQNLTSQVTWSSSIHAVATISNAAANKGVATVKGAGTTTITATYSGKAGSAVLTGTTATLVSIAITPATWSLPVGSTKQLIATGTYSDGTSLNITTQVAWKSSQKSKVSVTNAGVAKGVASGSSTITAKKAGVTGSATVTVP